MNITATDGYKFSMGEAGAALRREAFYYSHRRGGWQYLPVDVEAFIQKVLPFPVKEDYEYLSQHRYEVGAAYRQAFEAENSWDVLPLPKGSWFYEREPVFTVVGPSALVSWLEPHMIMLQFRIQVATAGKLNQIDDRFKFATCNREREIIKETLDSIGVRCPPIAVRSDAYYADVLKRAQDLVSVVKDPNRLFEVGMRAVSCMEQHEIALQAIKEAGILRTSNVYLAQKLGMIPVGTMGHEHVQRYGQDYDAYIAMRDRFPGFLFYLPDTFDTVRSGIPSALQAMIERPDRIAGIRFDSEEGIRSHYLYAITQAQQKGLVPTLALESGWNHKLTVDFENLREISGWPANKQCYGYGGYLVKPQWKTFLRDDVSAVYKLCKTGNRPTMKFGDEPNGGKSSIPGIPVVWRPAPLTVGPDVPHSFIAQEDEDVSSVWGNFVKVTGDTDPDRLLDPVNQKGLPPRCSPETEVMIKICTRERSIALANAARLGET